MTIPSGTRLGCYEIRSPLGAGGMGEVYRAFDSRLNREVAIKVIPEVFARDSDRLARFQREAQVLASLNHPNVAAIYGLEESDGVSALVMELVEGPTLEDRLAGGPIPVGESLATARQIAEALEVAHEHGVIHRDLKPANVKVTPDDKVKVLDFGLAKVLADESNVADLSNSPTMIKGTAAGMILGTAAYMSPEQARGRAVDKRTDLWAFGVLLMEMLTGKPLFKGDTVSDVIAAVLTQDVDWRALPDATPPSIRRLLRRCLQKDRKNRLGDAASAKLEIDDALSGASDDSATANVAPRAHSWRRTLLRVVLPTVLLTALVVTFLIWTLQRAAPSSSRQLTLTVAPPAGIRLRPVGTMSSMPHISPDGSAVMLEGDDPRVLYVRRLDSLDLLPVPGSDLVSNESFWHGSSTITFPAGSRRQLLSVRLPDGAPETVMPLGLLVFDSGSGVVRSQLTWFEVGGKKLGTIGEPAMFLSISISPDGRRALAAIQGNASQSLWMYDLNRGSASRFTTGSESFYTPAWSPDGRLVVYTGQNRYLYLQASDGISEAQKLQTGQITNIPCSWSPDSRMVVFATQTSEGGDLWIQSLEGDNKPYPFLVTPANEIEGVISPDGRWIAFVSDETGRYELYITSFPSSGGKRQISSDGADSPQWLNGGRQLAYINADRKLVLVDVKASEQGFEMGQSQVLFGGKPLPAGPSAADFRDVPVYLTPDGKRILLPVPVDTDSSLPLNLITNWPAALK